MKKFDAIIIGSGQAGSPLAKKLAGAGWKTALVEKRLIGGTCINDGCTPTKSLVASARAVYMASQKGPELGVNTKEVSVDFSRVMKRMKDIVSLFREGSEKGLRETDNLELIFGEAAFTGIKTLEVTLTGGGKEEYSADYIFINTGTRTAIPKIEGIENVPYLTSTSILDIHSVPEKLLILGGGYIGLEFGQMFKRFGSDVTIIDSSEHFLPKEDEDTADEIRRILEEDGLKFHTRSVPLKIEQESDRSIRVHFKKSGKTHSVSCTHVLVAAGRVPQSELLNAERSGIKVNEKGFIVVNDQLETNVDGVYALGEANGGPAFTHIAYNDYIIVWQNLLNRAGLSTKDRPLPYCMFTDPQLARIGLSEKQAVEKGYNIRVAKLPMENVARAVETSETRGFMKAVVDADTKKILGAAIIGAEGGEVMSVLQLAIQAGMTYEQIRFNIFAHPTFSESLNNLFMKLDA